MRTMRSYSGATSDPHYFAVTLLVNDSVLGARMVEAKDSGSEEKCNSVFEFNHEEDGGNLLLSKGIIPPLTM